MKRGLKWLGYIVGGFIALVVVAVGTVYAITSSRLARTYPLEVETVAIPTDSASIERGRHLTLAVGKCADCHGENLAGKRMMDAGIFMKLTAPNLTAGQGGTASRYTDADWVRAIRYGVRPDGKPFIFMPSESYTALSDSDLGAMIAYLKTVPPADDKVEPARAPGPIARIIYFTSDFPLIPAELIDRNQSRAAVTPGVTVEYGKYLSDVGGCTGCHLPNLAGGRSMERVVTTNLTRGGPMASWTEEDFIKAMRTGLRPDGTTISDVMPWKSMGHLTDDELKATWLFMRSVPPVS